MGKLRPSEHTSSAIVHSPELAVANITANVARTRPLWRLLTRRDVMSWSLYDFANTIFSMNIVSSYFKPWIVEDLGKDGYLFDFAVSASMLALAALSPALGVLSDYQSRNKIWTLVFSGLCVVAVVAFGLLPESSFGAIIILFALSNFFYEGAIVFYNALLYSITTHWRDARFVSGVGTAVGYIGTIVGLIAVLPFVRDGGNHAAFLPTAGLFALFALPLVFFVSEKKSVEVGKRPSLSAAYRETFATLRNAGKYPGLRRFLAADFFIKNAMNVIIINIGVYCLFVIGFSTEEKTIFLSIVPIAAIVGSYIVGLVAVNASLKKMIIGVTGLWVVCMLFFGLAQERWQFWVLAMMAGALLGSVWTLHRPYLAELVSRGQIGRVFALNTLTGRAAASIGPLWWALFFWLFEPSSAVGTFTVQLLSLNAEAASQLPYRAAATSLAFFLLCGMLLMRGLPETAGHKDE